MSLAKSKLISLISAAPYMKCGNKAEFRQRLQWLSEGMLRNHMESIINYTPDRVEIDLYRTYKEVSDELVCPSPVVDVSQAGMFSGLITDVTNGVATQKINREGDVVYHAVKALSEVVTQGQVVDVKYAGNGVGIVGGRGVEDLGR